MSKGMITALFVIGLFVFMLGFALGRVIPETSVPQGAICPDQDPSYNIFVTQHEPDLSDETDRVAVSSSMDDVLAENARLKEEHVVLLRDIRVLEEELLVCSTKAEYLSEELALDELTREFRRMPEAQALSGHDLQKFEARILSRINHLPQPWQVSDAIQEMNDYDAKVADWNKRWFKIGGTWEHPDAQKLQLERNQLIQAHKLRMQGIFNGPDLALILPENN